MVPQADMYNGIPIPCRKNTEPKFVTKKNRCVAHVSPRRNGRKKERTRVVSEDAERGRKVARRREESVSGVAAWLATRIRGDDSEL